MRICYINPTNNIRRPIAQLASQLAKEGHTISILYPNSPECPTQNWNANILIKQGQVKELPLPSHYITTLRYSFPKIISAIKATKQIFKKHDIIHIWEYYYPINIIPLLYALLTNQTRKVILTTDGFVGYSYKPQEPWWLTPAFRMYTTIFAHFLFKIPKTITTYGQAMIPAARAAGVPKNKLKILPTGIHIREFQKRNETAIQKIKTECNIKDEKIVLFVGMLTKRKGVDKVIKLTQKLKEEDYNIKTILVGDSHGPNLFKKSIKTQYQKDIIFTGGRKDIKDFMHFANVLLLPSEGEGLPGVVMEAMAAGLPVIATHEGCTSDLIETDKEGILVKNQDYLTPLKKLLSNEKLCKHLARNAQKKIEQFKWENVRRQYLSLYQQQLKMK